MNLMWPSGELPLSTLLIGIGIILLLYWYSIRNHNFWKEKNVAFIRPYPFFGTLLDMMRKPGHEVELERYLKYGSIYGHFETNKPMLSVAEPSLLKHILVKDTHIFQGNRFTSTGNKLLDNMLTMCKGENWKRLRSIISPTFSTGKMKKLMGILNECCETLVNNLEHNRKETFNAKSVFGAFTLDVIASSAFSTKLNSLQDPNNKFVRMARKLFSSGFNWRLVAVIFFPGLMRMMGESFFSSESMQFFSDVTHQIIQERKRTGQTANDFLQLLLDTCDEAENGGRRSKQAAEENDDITENYGVQDVNQYSIRNSSTKSLSTDEMVSQCVAFFLAGYESTSTTLSFVAYFLALHPEIQEKVHAEISKVLRENQEGISYEALQKMKYLDNVIAETLRLYPPAYRTERKAETEYILGDTGITIPKGTIVTIPIYALHRDPRNFPNPQKFDPDRFSSEERSKRDSMAYIPFGAGPRNCVALRFALLEMKVCLVHLLNKFEIKKCVHTKEKLDFLLGHPMLQPKEIILLLKPRQKVSEN